jgi:ammonia channel protein AmtB
MTFGLRVSREEEIAGLDAFEHGNEAYGRDSFSATAAESAA